MDGEGEGNGRSERSAKRRRVLLVDSCEHSARAIARLLRREAVVDIALDTEAALRALARESFDLIVCDMELLDFDVEALRRGLARNAGCRLVFTGHPIAIEHHSGYARSLVERNQRALRIAGAPFLPKPQIATEVWDFVDSKAGSAFRVL